MIDVYRIDIPKEQLLKMTQEERGLFLLLGYASNQVNVLWKLVIIATNRNPVDPIDQRVSAAQTQILVRLIIGVLREAYGLIEKRFLQSTIGREFRPLIPLSAGEALKDLQKRFGQSSMIVDIRTNYAFHHPNLNDMEEAFQQAVRDASENADWSVYMTDTVLNSFFFVSDFVIAHGIAKAVGTGDLLEAHKKLLGELGPIASDFTEFSLGFARAIFAKYFGPELTLTVVSKIGDAPNIDDLTFPFYLEMPKEQKKPP